MSYSSSLENEMSKLRKEKELVLAQQQAAVGAGENKKTTQPSQGLKWEATALSLEGTATNFEKLKKKKILSQRQSIKTWHGVVASYLTPW